MDHDLPSITSNPTMMQAVVLLSGGHCWRFRWTPDQVDLLVKAMAACVADPAMAFDATDATVVAMQVEKLSMKPLQSPAKQADA